MLIEEYPYVDENGIEHEKLVRHYSDCSKRITQLQTGLDYDEAIDVYPCKYTYEESENDVEPVTEPDAPVPEGEV